MPWFPIRCLFVASCLGASRQGPSCGRLTAGFDLHARLRVELQDSLVGEHKLKKSEITLWTVAWVMDEGATTAHAGQIYLSQIYTMCSSLLAWHVNSGTN
jgi:hypothetical protein